MAEEPGEVLRHRDPRVGQDVPGGAGGRDAVDLAMAGGAPGLAGADGGVGLAGPGRYPRFKLVIAAFLQVMVLLLLMRRGYVAAGAALAGDDVVMAWRAATHEIHVDVGRGVVKRFRSWGRGEPAREWNALRLLAEFAPGLAATPVRVDLTADPPVIEMSRLPGVPLGGAPLSAAQADALALALGRLWNAVPRGQADRAGRAGG